MTGMSDLLDGQALWDYGPDGRVVRPPGAASEQQRAAFTVAAQRATFALLAFNPHQRRGPDGKWVKMPTNELKRPRKAKKPRGAKKAVDPAPAAPPAGGDTADDLPQVNIPGQDPDYRRKRDEHNRIVLDYARAMQEKNRRDQGRADGDLQSFIDAAEDARDGKITPDPDDMIDFLQQDLVENYNGEVLDPPPPKAGDYVPPPVLPPGRRMPGGARPPLTDPHEARRQALDSSIRSGIVDQKVIGAGQMGDTRRVQLADGTEAIYKRALGDWYGWGAKEQTDAEELGALVAAAVGVRAPAIQRADDTNLYMEVMPGVPALARGIYNPQQELTDNPQGMRMGLLDVLLNNIDRHAGNWMIDDRGQIAAIDHGLAFRESSTDSSSATRSRFSTDHFITDVGEYKDTNPLTRGDVEQIRSDLERVRPRFEELGRADWLDQVGQRLDKLANRAAGYRSLLEDAPAMF